VIREITDKEEFYSKINSESLLLADFYADWCEPCKWLDPILEDIDKRTPIPLEIIKINTDKFLELSQEYHLRSVPVLMVFRKGEVLWRMNGFMLTDELIKKLEEIYHGKQ